MIRFQKIAKNDAPVVQKMPNFFITFFSKNHFKQNEIIINRKSIEFVYINNIKDLMKKINNDLLNSNQNKQIYKKKIY